MSLYQEQILSAIRATKIEASTRYRWFDNAGPSLDTDSEQKLSAANARNFLLYHLRSELYINFYCSGLARERTIQPAFASEGDPDLVAALSSVNRRVAFCDEDWLIHSRHDSEFVVTKDGLSIIAEQADIVQANELSLVPGTKITLRLPKEFLGFSPGFYLVEAEGIAANPSDVDSVRFYFNLTSSGAVPFLDAVLSQLDGCGIPYQVKVLNDPRRFNRCDSAVVYVAKAHCQIFSALIADIYRHIRQHLNPSVPAFTKPLGRGIALAEDPGDGQSFGFSRCKILAEGLIRGFEQRATGEEQQLALVRQCFQEHGVDPEIPFISRGSSDKYEVLIAVEESAPHLSADSGETSEYRTVRDSFLLKAAAVSRALCESALWSTEWCTWLEPDFKSPGSATVGPDLYSGCSGIALFLAEFSAVSGDPYSNRVAIGAINQAIRLASSTPPAFGLYTGALGVVFAAMRIGTLLNRPEILDSARALLARVVREYRSDLQFDLLAGKAGTVIGSLLVRPLWPDGSADEFIKSLAHALIAQGTERPTWREWSEEEASPLTGYSHGAAGVAQALLEAAVATNCDEFRIAGEQAIAFERACYDSAEKNWPDFRDKRRSFFTGWCHGAPGIGLSRIRANKLIPNPSYLAEAETALGTTKAWLESALTTASPAGCLCHGATGNAEVLVIGARELPRPDPSWLEVATKAATNRVGVEGQIEAPGLLVGQAGAGHFWLRLYAPAVPSVLLLEHERFACG
jgi:hypothetical protein